ncbi:MAG: beta-N-acetylglucosaminidase domain-containing protein [Deltaproteobacteria bacterium]|nr:beta-N-acetylglucosaminidase domain-containing protein [Deltaproteobacteria bacterium]
MSGRIAFQRRGIVEGFFGPPWSMSHRGALFDFGARRGMNTYLYAPKDDPYHRERWAEPYPRAEWNALLKLIKLAQKHRIDFVYGFHPGKGLRFSERQPVEFLLSKAEGFYQAGVRTFAVLFDDIPSRLENSDDEKAFKGSLARAEGLWLQKILERQPGSWTDVEWWICPSLYTKDPLLARMFGAFEPSFWNTLSQYLPQAVACLWTGPAVVSEKISLAHARRVARQLNHRLILWDNYPVNDLSMSDEMHLSPLTGRDPRLPEVVYGYLSNPLLQESLSLIPLATCLDYAASPATYNSQASWDWAIVEKFGVEGLPYWQTLTDFCERINKSKRTKRPLAVDPATLRRLDEAHSYLMENRKQRWAEEFRPWLHRLETAMNGAALAGSASAGARTRNSSARK